MLKSRDRLTAEVVQANELDAPLERESDGQNA